MTVKDDAANLAAASGAVVITNVMPEAAPSGGGLHPALAKRVEVAWKTDDPAQYSDVRRICSIPIAGPLTDAEVEEFSRRNVLAAAYESGFRLREGQARVVVFYDRYGGVFAPLPCSAGKCVTGGTEFFDVESGRRMTVAEAVGRKLKVNAVDDRGRLKVCDAEAFPSGSKPCVRLRLDGGQTIFLSTDHPVLTGRGWVEAAQIVPGELVATPRRLLAHPTSAEVPDEEVILAAYLLTDGSVSETTGIAFSDASEATLKEIQAVVAGLGGTSSLSTPKDRCPTVHVHATLRGVCEKWALFGTSHTKRIPAAFYGLPQRQVALFLNRFWACDGHVGKRDLELTLTSPEMIVDVHALLLRLGISSRFSAKPTTWVYRGVRKRGVAWRLLVSGADALQFLNTVGDPLGSEARARALRDYFARATRAATNVDVVPIGLREMESIFDELGYPPKGAIVRDEASGRIVKSGRRRTEIRDFLALATDKQRVSARKFSEWVERSGYSGKYAWLAGSDLLWVRAESVTPIGEQPVYDLSVPEAGNFVAEGIVVHNTLASILVAERYWRRTAQKLLQAGTPDLPNRSLYLVPPEVYPQVMQQIGNRPPDIQWARARVPVTVPFVGLGGGMTQARREALATNYKRGCFVMPHSLMSARDGSKLLDLIEPGLLIVDEAHRFKNRSAARTKRLMSYVSRKLPQLVILSGSITNKSVKDYHHFLKPTLGVRSPLPHAPDLAYQWSEVVDTDADPSEDMKRPMAPLVDWAKFHFREEALKGLLPMDVSGFRRAHKLRMNTCPGVVAATDAGVPSTLIIATREVSHAVPGQQVALDALVRRVDDDWVTPNGDPIDHAIHKFKWLYELTAGFYYRLTWPVADEVAKRKNLSLVEAKDVVDRSIARHLAHGNYAKALRKWFADGSHQAGLDTPFLVGQDMARNGAKNVGQVLYDAWSAWKAAGVGVDGSTDDLVERDSQAVRVCDYKVRAARDWARALREQHGKVGGLLWIYHNEVGQWLYEVLKSDEALWADVPGGAHGPYGVLYAPAGEPHNRAIMDPSNSKKLVVASIVAHGTGKNLQAFEHQCVVQWPRSAGQAEQFLSRTHRTGQLADELRVDVLMAPEVKAAGGSEDYAGTDFDLKNLSACLRDATYVQQSTGSSQKVLIAQYDPLPRIYDQSILSELGFQPKKLDAQGEKALREKFG